MPETRYIDTYDNQGNVISHEPYTVSDEQLLLEQLSKETNESHVLVLRAIDNWGSLTLAQKDALLKFLAKFYIVAGVRLGLFRLG